MSDKVHAINGDKVKKINPWERYHEGFNKIIAAAQAPDKTSQPNSIFTNNAAFGG